jgi:hypothetical protein
LTEEFLTTDRRATSTLGVVVGSLLHEVYKEQVEEAMKPSGRS